MARNEQFDELTATQVDIGVLLSNLDADGNSFTNVNQINGSPVSDLGGMTIEQYTTEDDLPSSPSGPQIAFVEETNAYYGTVMDE